LSEGLDDKIVKVSRIIYSDFPLDSGFLKRSTTATAIPKMTLAIPACFPLTVPVRKRKIMTANRAMATPILMTAQFLQPDPLLEHAGLLPPVVGVFPGVEPGVLLGVGADDIEGMKMQTYESFQTSEGVAIPV
jgi:hypothetical protein